QWKLWVFRYSVYVSASRLPRPLAMASRSFLSMPMSICMPMETSGGSGRESVPELLHLLPLRGGGQAPAAGRLVVLQVGHGGGAGDGRRHRRVRHDVLQEELGPGADVQLLPGPLRH